jgi:hypothetical protein
MAITIYHLDIHNWLLPPELSKTSESRPRQMSQLAVPFFVCSVDNKRESSRSKHAMARPPVGAVATSDPSDA